jgi:hypothetical protein
MAPRWSGTLWGTMTTTEHKDRVAVMGVIAAAPVGHCVGEHALAHPDLGTTARQVLRRVHRAQPVNQDAARARVRKRDISFGPRSLRGLRAWDTMQSMHGTLRELRISPAGFIADRLTGGGRFLRLERLVENEWLRRYGSIRLAPGGGLRSLNLVPTATSEPRPVDPNHE